MVTKLLRIKILARDCPVHQHARSSDWRLRIWRNVGQNRTKANTCCCNCNSGGKQHFLIFTLGFFASLSLTKSEMRPCCQDQISRNLPVVISHNLDQENQPCSESWNTHLYVREFDVKNPIMKMHLETDLIVHSGYKKPIFSQVHAKSDFSQIKIAKFEIVLY
jgi:hypothetical protein